MDKIKTIFIVGPTASGKTSLGVDVAEYFGGEVVSADSMQIYKQMNIATAKPTKEEMRRIPHYMIDFVDPNESYSVAKYKDDAMKCIQNISAKGKIPVIVGGTGLYIDTLIYNTEFFSTETDPNLRNRLYDECKTLGCEKMWKKLLEIDPEAAYKIHPNNSKKIIRALEIYYQTGKTLSEQNAVSRLAGEVLDPIIIGLDSTDRNYLYNRINQRVDLMLADGLLAEAEKFYSEYGAGTAVQSIGYKELLPYLQGESPLEECVEKLKMQTRRYAKRQLTWFRKNKSINWLYIDEYKNGGITDAAVKIIKERK